MPNRLMRRVSTTLVCAGGVAAAGGALYAQPAGIPTPETQQVIRPTQTVIQVDSASLVIGLGSLGATIGAGIRSAAGVLSRYMTTRDIKEAERDKAHSEVLRALTDIVGRYHADRGVVAAGLNEMNEDVDELRELVAEFVGKPKPKPRRRRAIPDDDGAPESAVSKS